MLVGTRAGRPVVWKGNVVETGSEPMSHINRVLISGAVVAGILVGVGTPMLAGQRNQKPPASIRWLRSMAQAKKEAARTKKPIMADFYAEWCPPCKEMLATTYKDRAVIEQARRFVPVLVDIDKHPKDTEAAGVEAVPTMVFYDSRGREVLRATGFHDAPALLELMRQAEKKAKR